MQTIKKMYRLADLRYPWLLLLSMLAFIVALCFNRFRPDAFARIEGILYGAIFMIALLWSIANYVDHLKVGALLRKHISIEAFVSSLTMGQAEKDELSQYLHDFASDLEQSGSTQEAAVQTAISHFQVKEFAASGHALLETPAHGYLLGYASIFFGCTVIIQCLDWLVSVPFILSAVSFTHALFGVAFLCLLFVYKLIDRMVEKKGAMHHG